MFHERPRHLHASILIAGIVLAIMVLPTISAISREVFLQVPRDHIEAALALGATRWEMVRMAIFPFARAASMCARGVWTKTSRVIAEIVGSTMIARTMPAIMIERV